MPRSEKVNVQALLRGYPGTANGTNPARRLAELKRVQEYWPKYVLRPITMGGIAAPPWRVLLDPTGWHDVPAEEVAQYVRSYVELHGRWPSLDTLRRKYGRVSNHRSGGEVVGQESLL